MVWYKVEYMMNFCGFEMTGSTDLGCAWICTYDFQSARLTLLTELHPQLFL